MRWLNSRWRMGWLNSLRRFLFQMLMWHAEAVPDVMITVFILFVVPVTTKESKSKESKAKQKNTD